MLHTLYRLFIPAKNPFVVKKEYNIPDKINVNFKLRPDGWFEITSPELPGLVTQAKNKEDRYIYSSLLFNELSSGFLLERILHLNVDTMKRMIKQRKNHIRREWQVITDHFEKNIITMK